jgi:hypothetical protein
MANTFPSDSHRKTFSQSQPLTVAMSEFDESLFVLHNPTFKTSTNLDDLDYRSVEYVTRAEKNDDNDTLFASVVGQLKTSTNLDDLNYQDVKYVTKAINNYGETSSESEEESSSPSTAERWTIL